MEERLRHEAKQRPISCGWGVLQDAADEIARLRRACAACQANPYDEAEYLDAMEAAMGVPPEPGGEVSASGKLIARLREENERLREVIRVGANQQTDLVYRLDVAEKQASTAQRCAAKDALLLAAAEKVIEASRSVAEVLSNPYLMDALAEWDKLNEDAR